VVRGFLLGLFLIVAIGVSVLSLRPGGLRRQLGFAARRLRIMLVLGGIYVVASTVVRVVAPDGPVADYAPPLLAIGLVIAFLFIARDPASTEAHNPASTAGRTPENEP
jgi:hypothetical protein